VRQFTYTAYLPCLKQKVRLKELHFNTYKHLVKCITNEDTDAIVVFFDELLEDLCIDKVNTAECSFLDKIILILTIRAICISPDLELTVTCPETQKVFDYKIQISDILDKLQNLDLTENVQHTTRVYSDGNLLIELGMPNTLNIENKNLKIINTVIKKVEVNKLDVTDNKHQIIDHLPALVLKDIKEYISNFNKLFNNVTLLSIESPYSENNKHVSVPLNLFSNSIIDFLKICFKRSLLSLYEMEFFLVSKLHLDHSLVIDSTPAELNLYLNLYNEERHAAEQARKESKSLNPLRS
jgi:hypothetical protein